MTLARTFATVSAERGSSRLLPFAALALLGVAGIAATPVAAAEMIIGPAVAGLTIDGDVGEWLDKSPSLLLPAAGPARSGRVWLAESADGLVVAGHLGGPPPQFPTNAAEINGSDHLRLVVSLVDGPPLPKIGWGEAAGPVELTTAADCASVESLADDENAIADCKTWFQEQVVYRQHFRRLFARRWRLAPGIAEEADATPALAALPASAREALRLLAPRTTPVARFKAPTGSGYSFEILIPWDALPPSPALELSRLHLGLGAVSARFGGASPPPAPEMLPARLEPPRRWQLSRCGFPLAGLDRSDASSRPAFFVPTAGPEVDTSFTIENPAADDQPPAETVSPGIMPATFFSQLLAPDVLVCGPPLAVRRGETLTTVAETLVSPGLKMSPVKGGWLVADGPYTGEGDRFAHDECGGCPVISLRVFFIAAAGGPPVTAFDDAWLIEDADLATGDGANARVTLRGDLGVIDAFEAEVDEEHGGRRQWSHVRHCYDADEHAFKECGRWPNVAPPAGAPMPPEAPLP
ncbi:MAG: hypothetical protein U1E42_02305 [Rhodospirillales bacterium]